MQSFIHKNLVEKAELNTHIKLGFSIPKFFPDTAFMTSIRKGHYFSFLSKHDQNQSPSNS